MMIFCHRHKPADFLFYTLVSLLNIVTIYYIDDNASYGLCRCSSGYPHSAGEIQTDSLCGPNWLVSLSREEA